MRPKNKDEVREKLVSLGNFLNMQSVLAESVLRGQDTLTWAADCIQSYLDGKEKTLDHAFGLRSSKRGPKPMESGEHDDWVVNAMQEHYNRLSTTRYTETTT